ncbi:LacI family DNA-binding transcriptional regulator [Candidatus Arthromitus sp. SFB-rat-Yit]|uniref:LacI family DNA-binding transcriptional regulator n=1 Tax=Candidatus Arthromitus sp. SFB-rat-Yit TaxID=1041504 RepID=UPI000227A1D6|nr:LacI family DNA-binding transcriptional regulator [Candidatus Arthromitus sp. SFB-rat-Yit]BAK80747.1 alanine racemase [Candidatus Arthromitus sp. SFB-rat-Yit]
MAISIKDVAKEAGVSIATVSRVLNGIEVVNEDTQKRVKEAVAKLGYRPNIIARSLKTQRTRTVGILIPDISNSLYPEIVRGIEDVSNIYNYNIILCNSDLNLDKEKEYIYILREKMVDGILFMSNSLEDEVLDIIQKLDMKTVLIETNVCNKNIPNITIDNIKASSEAVNKLISNGRRRILYIGDHKDTLNASAYRYKGYVKALEENGIKIDDELICYCKPFLNNGYEYIQKKIKEGVLFDGVFCTCDELAIGAINALRENRVDIPEECEIIGFNNILMSAAFSPKLTTIDTSSYDLGSIGMRTLIKIINNEQINNFNYVVPYNLIERESTR